MIHFIDNSSALYGMVKGYSSQPDNLSIIRAFHAANLAMRANVWFSYVASKANVADLPSRGALADMAIRLRRFSPSFSLADSRVDMVLPACPRDVDEVWEAVMLQLPAYRPSVPRSRGVRRTRRGRPTL